MNEKLNDIFVPVEVAKLAKEKGFNEKKPFTYSQLIDWISTNHYISITINYTEDYTIFKGWSVSKSMPINEALTVGLNLIEQ